ncbi:MAG: hypothetical protein ACOYOA_14265 [Saprospiraceae bacterium]
MKVELNTVFSPSDGEIKLFRKMSNILSRTYNVTFIAETHKQSVSYHSIAIKGAAIREISDLWIIAFSPLKSRARMTFLQAKYHRGILGTATPSFKGEFFQYELLSERPLIKNVGKKFTFPTDILSFSCCTSIGSYGVFFIDSSGQIDMAYSSASYLSLSSPGPKTYRSLPVNLSIPNIISSGTCICDCYVCSERISCFDIDTFTNAILDLEIGAELTPFPHILSFIQGFLAPQKGDPVINQFLNFDNNIPPDVAGDNTSVQDGLPINLLLINTDNEISK